MLGTYVGWHQLFASSGLLLDFGTPAIAMLVSFIAVIVYRAMTEEKDKAALRETFGKYVSPRVVDQLVQNPPELGGVDRDLTVFSRTSAVFDIF
jgi:adenylate cyclase